MAEWFMSKVLRDLLRFLARPLGYEQQKAVTILLKVMAKYYAVSLKILRSIGVATSEESPADKVSKEVYQEVVKGKITTQYQVEDLSSVKLDRRLVTYGSTSLVAARRLDNFFHLSFTNLVRKDKHAKNWCKDPDLFEQAFEKAFLGFMKAIRKEGEMLRSGGRNLFFTILKRKCITEIDRAKPKGGLTAIDFENQIKSQLQGFKWSSPPAVDLVLTIEDLKLLEGKNQKCYRLLNGFILGLDNKDLAKIHQTSVGAINDRLYRCRIKMWEEYQKLIKDHDRREKG